MIHLYTGNGQGKTSAATGLAVRCAGSGGRVAFVQFLKSMPSGEIAVLESIPRVSVLRNREAHGFSIDMTAEQKQRVCASHNENLEKAQAMISHGAITLLVLDELCAAYSLDLIDRAAVDSLIQGVGDVELIITGRDAPQSFLDAADYITDMLCIRHPYERGMAARRGVEF